MEMDAPMNESVQHLQLPAGGERTSEMCAESTQGAGKRAKADIGEQMKKVAEIVMVLSAMGNIRGGREPTAFEKGMMMGARQLLVDICQSVVPRDLVTGDAARALIEDLGLNKLKDEMSGFRPPKITILEKLALAKRRMEESRDTHTQSPTYSYQGLQMSVGANTYSHAAAFHSGASTKFLSDKTNSSSLSSGGFHSTPIAPVPALASATRNAFPNKHEMQPQPSSFGLTSQSGNLVGSDYHARAKHSHYLVDQMHKGAQHALHANSSVDNVQENCSGSQLLSPSVPGLTQEVKVSDHIPVAEKGQASSSSHLVSQPARDHKSHTYMVQMGPSYGVNILQPTNLQSTTHVEICKSVQKVVQPRNFDSVKWVPPSLDYMNKPLSCEVCKLVINDVDNLLVCDACEQGVHLKCLHSFNQRLIPIDEWHCPKCLTLSRGRPFPPKYGRVSRNVGAMKLSTGTGIHASSVKVEISGQNVSGQQKMLDNEDPDLLNTDQVASVSRTHFEAADDLKEAYPAKTETISSSTLKKDEAVPKESPSEDGYLSSRDANNTNSRLPLESGTEPFSDSSSAGTLDPSRWSQVACNHDSKIQLQGGAEVCRSKISVTSRNQYIELGSPTVSWVGDIIKVVDEKKYYESCCVNGKIYSLQSHVLFCHFDNKMSPLQLEVLWEDSTGVKLAGAKVYLFPNELPEAVGRPSIPDDDEVYGSNQRIELAVDLIYGPCQVLAPNTFTKETTGKDMLNGTLGQVFLCRWFYDDAKALFRPVTS